MTDAKNIHYVSEIDDEAIDRAIRLNPHRIIYTSHHFGDTEIRALTGCAKSVSTGGGTLHRFYNLEEVECVLNADKGKYCPLSKAQTIQYVKQRQGKVNLRERLLRKLYERKNAGE
jgi:hypothetical protein